jgi:hypothetical protein
MFVRNALRAIVAVLGLAIAAPSSAQPICNRACLAGKLELYLKALVAHAPDGAPLAANFRQTQNAVAIAPGKGLWQEMIAIGPVDRRYFDATSGTAGFFGSVMLAGGEPAIVSLRLHVAAARIDEAEWNVARSNSPGISATARSTFNFENLRANPPVERSVAPRDRLSRTELIAIANSYFDGITAENAELIRAHKGCRRLENGTGAPPGARGDDGGPPDCTSGQGKFDVAFVAGRRFPLVDEQSQVVLVIGTFIRKPGNPKRRNQFHEYFFIDHGKIRDVYAAFFYPDPAQAVPNWPPYEGNFPLPVDFGAAK